MATSISPADIDETDISRDTHEGRHEEIDEIRLYQYDPTGETLPSVTTVLKSRDEDKSNLYDWQDRNDGEGDNAFHEHLFWYKRNRGTLCHWHALSELDPDLEWTEDEADSLWAINNISELTDEGDVQAHDDRLGEFTADGSDHTEVFDGSPKDVLYSVLKSQHAVESWGEFYDQHNPYKNHDHFSGALDAQNTRDVDYFVETFNSIREELGVTQDDVIAVEEFLFNAEDGYAGQVDLVYECPATGDTVVADLKTSSGCYDKHKMQGAAYGNSVERLLGLECDRIEVWRIHPDTGQWAVHAPREPTDIHTSEWWRKDYDELLDGFLDLAENFQYSTK